MQAITDEHELSGSFLIRNFVERNHCEGRWEAPAARGPLPEQLADALMLARNLFDLREYKKCAHLLKEKVWQGSPEVDFLYHYSLWVFGQFRKEEQVYEDEGSGKPPHNPAVPQLIREMWPRRRELDPLSKYVLGLALKESERTEEALETLFEVINELPCFWSCWL